jgi:hypothetical protein
VIGPLLITDYRSRTKVLDLFLLFDIVKTSKIKKHAQMRSMFDVHT